MPSPSLYLSLILLSLPGVGCARYWKLRQHIGSAAAILETEDERVNAILPPPAQQALKNYHQHGDSCDIARQAQEILKQAERQGVQLIHAEHEHYPERLRQISHAPPLLYVRGEPSLLCMPQIAIVGSRCPTGPGEQAAHDFACHLAQQGFTITSGLALGIDGAAHRGALAGKGGTLAVLGTGVDVSYPSRHQRLAEEIVIQGGALISEFPFGTRPASHHFPRRNRIISGLCYGVLVVEAKLKSGSLITARFAAEQNREVFALPGSIHNPLARGCHALIKDGATLVEKSQDIVEHLRGFLASDWEQLKTQHAGIVHQEPLPALSPTSRQILHIMGYDVTPADDIATKMSLPIAEITTHLMDLELDGLIRATDNGYLRIQGDEQSHLETTDANTLKKRV